MGAFEMVGNFLLLVMLILICLALFFFFLWLVWRRRAPLALERVEKNPVLAPLPAHWWESQAVFNPAAYYDGKRVHVLYRAMGDDGVSRIGYASSVDGVHFDERLPYPVFAPDRGFGVAHARRIYTPLTYDTHIYASGGGWGGAEDPRMVEIDGTVYMTFTAFDGWGFLRMALTSLPVADFLGHRWGWTTPAFLSAPNEINKNFILFPEKINGKYAILYLISPRIEIAYIDDLRLFEDENFYIKSPPRSGGRPGHWDAVVRGAGAPPIKTKEGWLLLYHGFDPAHPDIGYKVGAMLLDLTDPTTVLARSEAPILEAQEWYENDWKPGVTYASGAVVVNGEFIVYYGGGDKYVAAAKTDLDDFVQKLVHHKPASLTPVTM